MRPRQRRPNNSHSDPKLLLLFATSASERVYSAREIILLNEGEVVIEWDLNIDDSEDPDEHEIGGQG
jgi:hypothetical protein